MVYGTHLSSIYQEHENELRKRYRRVAFRGAVASLEDYQAFRTESPIFSSSHTTAATVRLAAKTSLDIVV